MKIAMEAATLSPDPSTQNGAAVLLADGRVVGADCNRFPVGVTESAERWERPLKYSFIEHAERNAIFNAARQGIKTEGATLVCQWAACSDCARAIVAAGFARLVRVRSDKEAHSQWAEEVALGDEIMIEGGVEIVELPAVGLKIPRLRRNGEIWIP
jgi:dCMP deaminase